MSRESDGGHLLESADSTDLMSISSGCSVDAAFDRQWGLCVDVESLFGHGITHQGRSASASLTSVGSSEAGSGKGQLCEEPLPARARSDSDTFSIERWGDDDGTGRSSATTLQIGGGASCCSSPLAAFSGSEQCEEPSPVDAEATAAERQASAAEEKAACGANMPVPSCRTPCARSRSCSSSSGSVARSSPSPGAARLPPVGLFSTPVNRPQCPAGCEHWQGPLWDATSTHRAKLPRKPSRRVLQVLLCAGMGAELLANWSMALDEIDVVSVHEVKRYAQRWLQRLWGSKVQHIFVENYALVAGSGWCVKHGKRCAVPLGRRLDIASGGFPCKPFSLQRQRTGSTASTGPNEKHPQYATVMDEMDDILQAARPLTFWMEEVEQFTSKRAALGGLSPLDVCAKKWRTHGYALRAVILDHFLFVEVPKKRCFILGFHKDGGFEKAADWAVDFIQSAARHRLLTPPTQILDLIDPNGPEETRRRASCKDCVTRKYSRIHTFVGVNRKPN